MKTRAGKILPLTALAILLVYTAPSAFASTLTVNLNPTTQMAKVTMNSFTNIVLTYPNGSQLSSYLKGVNSSVKLNGNYAFGSDGVQTLQSSFNDDDEGGSATIKNMSVSFSYVAKGNTTALTISKQTNITAWVSGVFKVVNGSVTADLKWRSFVVVSALNLNFGSSSEEVNYAGGVAQESLATHAIAASFLVNMFGGSEIWHRPTLNYSELNSPLSTWTKNYDSGTNTTTFSKTISGTSTFTSSADFNGQKYTFSAISDPSAVIAMQGYASASGDSLTLGTAPASTSPLLLATAVAALVVIAGVAYLVLKARAVRAKPLAIPTPSSS